MRWAWWGWRSGRGSCRGGARKEGMRPRALAAREARMSKAIVDPDEVRRFATDLKRFSAMLDGSMRQLQGRLNALGQTWRDQEHQKFTVEFEDTMRVLARFVAAADKQVPFLLRKAEKAEEYLRQR